MPQTKHLFAGSKNLQVHPSARVSEQQATMGRGLAASDLIPAIRQLLEEQHRV